MKKRPIFNTILKRFQEPRRFIQVLIGPRQVGKTTLALQLTDELKVPYHFASADTVTLEDLTWLQQQWDIARNLKSSSSCILIIDEVQKIPNWSNLVKALWDEDTRNQINLKVLILGSSPWLIQQGLTESLSGRFEIIPITHWSFTEMNSIFNWDLEKYIYFGGYPGSAPLIDEEDQIRWKNYINDSLIETTISKDILLMKQINKPVLLRRLLHLGCTYSAQILSYTKMLGQLHDKGNTTTLAHYLELLAGAGLLDGIQKFSNQIIQQRNSSPKLSVLNTALITALSNLSFNEAVKEPRFWGRLVESMIGAHLLNSIKGTQIKLFYWREGDKEVDFVLQYGSSFTPIEVKSGKDGYLSSKLSGMEEFCKKFKPKKILLVGKNGISIEEFLRMPILEFVT